MLYFLGGRGNPVALMATSPRATRPGQRSWSPSRTHTLWASLTQSSGRTDLPRLRPPVRSLWRTCGGLRARPQSDPLPPLFRLAWSLRRGVGVGVGARVTDTEVSIAPSLGFPKEPLSAPLSSPRQQLISAKKPGTSALSLQTSFVLPPRGLTKGLEIKGLGVRRG